MDNRDGFTRDLPAAAHDVVGDALTATANPAA